MADQNPIKYVDLIQPDDSIEKLVKQLDEANEAYNNLAGSIKTQAASITASLKSISGASESGRATTRAYSADAEKLLKAERDLNFARSETARKIAELNAMKKDEQTITKLTVQLNRATAGSYEALSAQYGLNKIRLNAMTEEYRRNTAEGQKLEKETADLYERMNELQKATGKYTLQVGNYEKAVGQLMGAESRWMKNLQTISGIFQGGVTNAIKMATQQVAVFGKQLLALMANPIVATIAAIAAAFMLLAKGITSSEQNTRSLERILAPFQRILTGIVAVLQEAAGWLLKGVEGMEKMAMAASRFAERLPIVGKYLRNVNDALEENIRLTQEKQELEDLKRTNLVRNAKLEEDIAKWRAAAEKTDDPKLRVKYLKMANAAQESQMYNMLDEAQKEYNIKKQLAEQSQNDAQANQELAEAEANLSRVRAAMYQRQIRLNSKLRREEEKMNKSGGSSTTSTANSDAERIANERMQIERKTQELRLQMIEDYFDREYALTVNSYQVQIEELQKKGEKEVALRESINKEIEALELQKNIKLADIILKYNEKAVEAEKKLAEDKRKAAESVTRTQMDVINKEADLHDLEIDNLQTSENEKTDLRLKAEKERLKKIYDLLLKNGKDVSDLELRIIREQMKKLDDEISKNEKKKDIFDILGFKFNDEQKQLITSAFDFAKQQLDDYMAAWEAAAEKKVELANKEVEAAQKALDAEREARANGYASNVAYAQKELDMAKKNQQKALAEQQRAQRAQEAMQSVQQASNLITATSLIFAQFGNPLIAIPLVALMWGAFAAAKIKAMQLTQSTDEEYGEGTVELLQGGSHQSGNDVDLGRKKDGTRRRAEGGEFFAVINKRNSRRYRKIIPDVINSLNGGTFQDKYMRAFDGGNQYVNVQADRPDLRQLGDDVRAIRQQGDRRTFTDERGTHIVYKNLHRVIKN